MSEEKRFEATPNKIRRARKEGNVPRSQELNTVVVFAAATATTVAIAPLIGVEMREWFAGAPYGTISVSQHAIMLAILTAIPLCAAAVAGVAITILQTGGLIVVPPKLKPEHLKPNDGFKRMFSKESAISAARAVIAFAVCGAAFIPIVRELFTQATSAKELPVLGMLGLNEGARIAFTAIAVAAVFSVIDVILARQRWRKNLRMDFYEFKRDHWENEGNPLVKGRRKRNHRTIIRGSVGAVKTASVVVTNPTHIAVALQYDPPLIPVPLVLVAAADEVALRVKALARGYGVAVVENVALARLLYATATVGATIPRETFVAVAEIIVALAREEAQTA